MSQRILIKLMKNWQFHQGEIPTPRMLSMKALSLGGLTAPLKNEEGTRLPLGPSGQHFLTLVGQGNQQLGLKIVADTDVSSELDDSWKTIDLPHDWKRELPYTKRADLKMKGFKSDGVAYYRRSFTLNENLKGQKIILHLEGVMGICDLWYNGAYLSHNLSGYVTQQIDISALSRYGHEGNDTLLVKSDTRNGAEGWWNEGAGIYRPVYLEVINPIHLESDNCILQTKKLTQTTAKIHAQMKIKNDNDASATVHPQITIGNQTVQLGTISLPAHSKQTLTQDFKMDSPHCWSPEDPYLYKVSFAIETDQIVKNYGIKTVKYTTDGFFLNNNPYEIHGVCYHQDFAGVGIAQTEEMLNYKLQRFKDAGINAIRSAHHFASPELLDACDHCGILLMNENRLLETTPWRLENLKQMVCQSRMHPCLAFWSLSNEELIGNTQLAARLNHQIANIVRKYDSDHIIVQAELLNPEGQINPDYIKNIDVLGVNYPESPLMGGGADLIHQKYPQLPMMCTENASFFTTRGNYYDDQQAGALNALGSRYSTIAPGLGKRGDPGVGGQATPQQVLNYVKTHPYMGGAFIWLGADCYGEPSPMDWPAVTSSYGITDICGFPKDDYYYYQAHWLPQDRLCLHVAPSWNKDRLTIDKNGKTTVCIYTNADEVEVFVNQTSYGRHQVRDRTVSLPVTYEPGVLQVIAYRQGKKVKIATQTTTKQASHTTHKLLADGPNVCIYQLEARDQNDHLVPDANCKVNVSVKNGKVWALANGNPIDQDDSSKQQIRFYNGLALAIIRKNQSNQHPTISIKKLPRKRS